MTFLTSFMLSFLASYTLGALAMLVMCLKPEQKRQPRRLSQRERRLLGLDPAQDVPFAHGEHLRAGAADRTDEALDQYTRMLEQRGTALLRTWENGKAK